MDDSRNSILTKYKVNILGFRGVKIWNKLCMYIITCLELA